MSTRVERAGSVESPSESRLARLTKRQIKTEIFLVLSLSLGASAVYSIISLIRTALRPGGLASATATLNTPASTGSSWMVLFLQLLGIFFGGLIPAFLAWHLLGHDHADVPKLLGVDLTRPRRDLLTGVGLAALIGIPGLGLYWLARMLGINATIQAESISGYWWAIPVLIISAIQNGIYEEIIVVGYFTTRLQQLGLRIVPIILLSATLRGSYHLYQGIGGFVGNFVMGVIFAYMYRWYGRVLPLIIAHSILDIASFVGYDLLVSHWSFLR